ncbi:MAG: cadherin-like domain-containing protein, partial [Desulfofustis sp.]|nr:cadherin-like domain-containing protein [Desulfofustis sp.]
MFTSLVAPRANINITLAFSFLVILLGFSANIYAAKPSGGGSGGKGPACTISSPQNDPVEITTGGSVNFQGVVSGGTPPYQVTWTFQEGSPSSSQEILANSGDTTDIYNVVYDSAGSFTTTMQATDGNSKRAKSCQTSFTVVVTGDTGSNNRPIAQNDEYNTQQDTPLAIASPGVLSNDNDPEGDPMTSQLETNASFGSVSLNSDGSFTYTPNSGATGSDSFTYSANDAGGSSNIATVTIGIAENNQVSINSTSANGSPTISVSEQEPVSDPDYALVAINDLGMHCGDLDTRVSSILPPFNVLHAQVIKRGIGGKPRILGEGEVELFYSAASNPNDPALSKAVPDQALSSALENGTVFKTNFWDIASQAYGPFYPAGILDAFYDPNTSANNIDIGLPVPDVERLYLEDGELHASQQAMPGINTPYASNTPQKFKEHIGTMPFFVNFPFGYTADLNLFEAPGVPIAAFDDAGRENPYPLVRVEAHVAGNPVASLDTVMPISGEASCQSCHASV